MRQLAARVGLTSGALYNHFGSKQALLSGLLESVMTDLLAAAQHDVLCHSDPVQQLRAFVGRHIRFHVDRKNDVLIAPPSCAASAAQIWLRLSGCAIVTRPYSAQS